MERAISAVITTLVFCGACLSQQGQKISQQPPAIATHLGVQRMADVGVYRGDFAAQVLHRCECLTAYYMIDPWRHLDD